MIRKYRKLPVVIEAVQWTGENLREIIDFIGLHPSAKKWSWKEYVQVVRIEGLKIFTHEGSLIVTIGDFIIKGIHGELYPCKPDIFAKTYEEAPDGR
jgi:preprotein translocase subunit Sss1